MIRGLVAAILGTSATPMSLSRSLTAAAGPHILCCEWSDGRRTSWAGDSRHTSPVWSRYAPSCVSS